MAHQGVYRGTWTQFSSNLARGKELLHKYIDDLTVSEIFNKNEGSKMNNVLSEIQQWSARNFLNIIGSKTKDIFLCAFNRSSVEPLKLNDVEIESVSSFKLLGVHVDCNLKRNSHNDSICSKANMRV
jgi:hypothetical protein